MMSVEIFVVFVIGIIFNININIMMIIVIIIINMIIILLLIIIIIIFIIIIKIIMIIIDTIISQTLHYLIKDEGKVMSKSSYTKGR